MRTRGLSRFVAIISLAVLSVGFALVPSVAFASCITDRQDCRNDADRRFLRGDVNEFEYGLLLSRCDIDIMLCWLGKGKQGGK